MKDKDWVLGQSVKYCTVSNPYNVNSIIPYESFLVSLKRPTLPSPCLYTSRVLPLNRTSFLHSELENTKNQPLRECKDYTYGQFCCQQMLIVSGYYALH